MNKHTLMVDYYFLHPTSTLQHNSQYTQRYFFSIVSGAVVLVDKDDPC